MTKVYRPDIDGLRAIAVLSVLLFHGGFQSFSGGFAGVDVFFVISGYLITNILLREIRDGSFSIMYFYERRMRRIFPALFLVLGATTIAGAMALTPGDFSDLGSSVAAAALFFSNMLFWTETGYFAGPAEYKPLLHTWSLSVEEQFYVIFPLSLLVIHRWLGGRFMLWIMLIGGLSLVVSIASTRYFPTAAFYWAPMRAWELLTGAVLALKVLPKVESHRVRDSASVVGLILILVSFMAISPSTPFPGIAAAFPVLGTALLIHLGENGTSRVHRLLSLRPLVFIGLISYSLYLWHWPMLVFSRYLIIRELTSGEVAVLLLLSVGIATLSWKFVETPFRRRELFERRQVFAYSALAIATASLAGFGIHAATGFPERFPVEGYAGHTFADPHWERWEECRRLPQESAPNGGLCRIGDDDRPEFLIWSDSHGHALATAIDAVAASHGKSGVIAIKDRCPPLLGVIRPSREDCARFNDAIASYVEQNTEIRKVLLIGRWALAAEGSRYKREEGHGVELADAWSNGDKGNNARLFELGIRRTVERLRSMGRRVILVSQVPEVGHHVPTAVHAARLTGRDVNEVIGPTVTEYLVRNKVVSDVFSDLASSKDVILVNPWRKICGREFCQVADERGAWYRDDDHLSTYGALAVSGIFEDIFRKAGGG